MLARRSTAKTHLTFSLSCLSIAASLLLAAPAQADELQDAAASVEALPPAARVLVADTNGDGRVTSAEANAFAAGYFAVIDADRDGVVSRAEYVGASLHGVWWPWLQAVAPDVRESFLADGFARHDLDRNGGVDVAEFVACTGTDFATADEDGDGRVSVLEFYMLGLAIG